jgi:hypothetical protein
MKLTRRKFIRSLSATAALAAITFHPAGKVLAQAQAERRDHIFAPPSESTYDPLNYLVSEHFEPFINTSFSIEVSKEEFVELRLVEVTGFKNKVNLKRGFSGEGFSLLFEDTEIRRIESKTYLFRHNGLGDFSLFLSPTGLKGHRYEAVINRLSR